ncbi:MAG: class I SAM-dependent methyltransferase, partial [Planctomycetes bacterium]|nr:class I SAM-dependent methyltransferase [Planctomycetota bacterium]
EQERIRDDFMKYWHEVLPRRFGLIDRFNHSYPVKHARPFLRTLEIGAGLGEHLEYENLTSEQERNYYALELRAPMSQEIRRRFPRIRTITADCQERLPFPDGFFDRVLAIHVLEHLPNLPAAVRELHRVCDQERGLLFIVIPCEGSLAYNLARRISAQRLFEKRYRQPYQWFIEREHVNVPVEILGELRRYFQIRHRSFFPIPLPLLFCNLVIGLTLQPRKGAPCSACS